MGGGTSLRRLAEYRSSTPSPGEITLDYLYRRYASPLREFCRARLNGNGSEAEDACHDALLKAYRALPQFRPGPLWPWLATIAAHVCIDIHRKNSRTVELDERAEMQPAEDPEEEVARRTRIRIARKAMAQLPERYRTLITLRDYDGWGYEQIARTHGTSVGAVDSALVRARRALKALVEKEARREGSWPLPALVLGVLGRRSRASLREFVSAQYHPFHSLLARTGHMIAEVAVSAVVLAGPTAALSSSESFSSSSDEELHRPAEVGVIEPEDGQARPGPSAGREVRRPDVRVSARSFQKQRRLASLLLERRQPEPELVSGRQVQPQVNLRIGIDGFDLQPPPGCFHIGSQG